MFGEYSFILALIFKRKRQRREGRSVDSSSPKGSIIEPSACEKWHFLHVINFAKLITLEAPLRGSYSAPFTDWFLSYTTSSSPLPLCMPSILNTGMNSEEQNEITMIIIMAKRGRSFLEMRRKKFICFPDVYGWEDVMERMRELDDEGRMIMMMQVWWSHWGQMMGREEAPSNISIKQLEISWDNNISPSSSQERENNDYWSDDGDHDKAASRKQPRF